MYIYVGEQGNATPVSTNQYTTSRYNGVGVSNGQESGSDEYDGMTSKGGFGYGGSRAGHITLVGGGSYFISGYSGL